MEKKQAIAIIIPGGIGTGKNNIGVPVLERIIKLLSADFRITVFQLFPRNKGFEASGFDLVDIYSPIVILKFLKFFLAFIRVHRQCRFKVVHGFWVLPGGLLAVMTAKLFGIKSVVSILGGDAINLPSINYGQLRSTFHRSLIFWALKNGDEVNALTQYLVNNLRTSGYSRDNIRIIPWGIDISMFLYQEKKLQSPVRFLHVGNLHPVKDQETLLKAFRIISKTVDSTLTIIGEGVLKPRLLTLIDQLQLQDRVTILNPLPYEQLPQYYREADILLHTSLSEGQCEVVTEAMSAGVLVCGTKVGLMYDLPDCCLSVDVRNHEQLAFRVLHVLDDPKTFYAIREKAYQWSLHHSISWTKDQITELYR